MSAVIPSGEPSKPRINDPTTSISRRSLMAGGTSVVGAAGLPSGAEPGGASSQPSGMTVEKADTAVVFIDPQNDVLSERGKNWGAVGASVTENKTVENMERIFKIAKANGYDVFISPHYFYPTDNGWKFNVPLETEELRTHTFARSGSLNLAGFPNSGADRLQRLQAYIDQGQTGASRPHKTRGPHTHRC